MTSDVIEKTHQAVFNKVENRIHLKGALQFFAAETGLGKTTGQQMAMKRLWKERWDGIPFLVLVPTRKDADLYWQAMEALEPGCAAVWTQVHDPSDSTTVENFEPSCQFTKEQAKQYLCLILTHNAGKAAEDWVGRRDAVLIDEYPQPVSNGTVHPWQFIKARDEELTEPFANAADWAEGQDGKGLTPCGLPTWVPSVLSSSPKGEAGKLIKRLAEHMQGGTAFQRCWKSVYWVYYDYDLPFEEKAIVFSATAHLEGWHFDPLSGGKVDRDGVRVNYRNMTANYVPWPCGVSRYHKDILSNFDQRTAFLDYIVEQVGFADEKTLLVCPKDLESDITRKFPEACVTHYGCDVGSNEYRDCSTVWLVSQFYQPKDVLYSKYLGHAKLTVNRDTLKGGQNTQSSLIKQLEHEHHSTQTKQMAARGTCRNVDGAGVADSMELNCLWYDVDQFTAIVPSVFQGCEVVYPDGHKVKPSQKKHTKAVTVKIAEHLGQTTKDCVTASDLNIAGISIKGKAKKVKIKDAEDMFTGLGWQFHEGEVGRKPARFVRHQ